MIKNYCINWFTFGLGLAFAIGSATEGRIATMVIESILAATQLPFMLRSLKV